MCCIRLKRQVAKLIDDQQLRLAEVGEAFLELWASASCATRIGAGTNSTEYPTIMAWRPIATARCRSDQSDRQVIGSRIRLPDA
jgi:hypothetical protein